MKRSKFVIVGLGQIGRDLLRRLSRDFELVCIDSGPDGEAAAKEIRGDEVRVVAGDATSRLVLEEAGVDEADAVLLTTTTEKITLEVAQVLANHFTVRRVIAVGITPGGIAALEALGVEVEGIFPLSANALRNRLEHRTKAVHGVGLGKDEILEVEVHPSSRLANKPLFKLRPHRWNIGLVYRDGNVVVPHGNTVLRGKDKVILLGEPRVLKTVAEILTFRFEQFPLEYGSTLTAFLSGGEDMSFFAELAYLASVFPLQRVVLLCSRGATSRRDEVHALAEQGGLKGMEWRDAPDAPLEALRAGLAQGQDMGGIFAFARGALMDSAIPFLSGPSRKFLLHELCRLARSPILLAAGSFPYGRIAVPCVPNVDTQHTLEAVLEMGSSLRSEASALLVTPPKHLSSEEEEAEFRETQKTISDIGLMYKTSITPVVLEGNPVVAVSRVLPDFDLLVADAGQWKRQGWLGYALNPDPGWHVVRRSPISTLLVPPVEESL